MVKTNKSLGQHWLHDKPSLVAMCDAIHLAKSDTVLEIGPGLGTLTAQLARRARQVVAVEFDEELAHSLPSRVQTPNIVVYNHDILTFDLTQLPSGYKVAANVPYYITSKIVQLLLTSRNRPSEISLLVQKEVAQRMAASAGDMSILAVATQYYSDATLGPVVLSELFTPPPKVDSQIIHLKTLDVKRYEDIDDKDYFRVVKAAFSSKRKILRSSLSAGLAIEKPVAETMLVGAGIKPDVRAQDVSLDEWAKLTRIVTARLAN